MSNILETIIKFLKNHILYITILTLMVKILIVLLFPLGLKKLNFKEVMVFRILLKWQMINNVMFTYLHYVDLVHYILIEL